MKFHAFVKKNAQMPVSVCNNGYSLLHGAGYTHCAFCRIGKVIGACDQACPGTAPCGEAKQA